MDDKKGQVWTLDALRTTQTELYQEFLRIPALSMGLYRLPAGGTDPQGPHNEDETYYVVSGRGKIDIDGTIYPAAAGAVIFVAAHTPHRFIDIEADMEILVFFAPGET